MPVGLHYCKRYYLDHWFFSKYRLKKKYISCETPLLEPPPLDLATRNITIAYQPPPHGHTHPEEWVAPQLSVPARQSKREAFMLCALMQRINEAAIHFKERNCEGRANMEHYSFFSDPNH
jgi:peptidyl serine alpha-galactosyltransferase